MKKRLLLDAIDDLLSMLLPMPPMLEGETSEQYTDRLTGADKTDRIPYKERRNRQCSIGWHGQCSDPRGKVCKCPCHTLPPVVQEAAFGRPQQGGS